MGCSTFTLLPTSVTGWSTTLHLCTASRDVSRIGGGAAEGEDSEVMQEDTGRRASRHRPLDAYVDELEAQSPK